MGHMVIDGRLHADSGDGIYRRVPTGMDEARTSKGAVFPEYAVENGVLYEIIRDPAAYARGLTVNGGSVIYAKASFRPDERRLLRLDRDAAFMVPDCVDGKRLLPQCVRKHGYMDFTDPDDVYGVSESSFENLYVVTRTEPGVVRDTSDLDAAFGDIGRDGRSADGPDFGF